MSVERARELLAEARVYQPPIPRPDETQGARARALDAAHAQRLALIAEAMIEAVGAPGIVAGSVTCSACDGTGNDEGTHVFRRCRVCGGTGKLHTIGTRCPVDVPGPTYSASVDGKTLSGPTSIEGT